MPTFFIIIATSSPSLSLAHSDVTVFPLADAPSARLTFKMPISQDTSLPQPSDQRPSPASTPSRAGTPSDGMVRPSSTTARPQAAQCTVPARLHQTHPTPASSAVPVRRRPLRVELATSPHSSLSCLARRPGTTRTSSCGSSQTFTCMYPEIHLSYLMLLEPTYSSTLEGKNENLTF